MFSEVLDNPQKQCLPCPAMYDEPFYTFEMFSEIGVNQFCHNKKKKKMREQMVISRIHKKADVSRGC